MNSDDARYHSYRLRLWRTDSLGASVRHSMLEETRTGERHSFLEFAELTAFLRSAIARQPPEAGRDGSGEMPG
jgi:hypothetical protein